MPHLEQRDVLFDKVRTEEAVRPISSPFLKMEVTLKISGFGGLEVACWPLVPKFAGSNPAEAVGFFRAKNILSTPSF